MLSYCAVGLKKLEQTQTDVARLQNELAIKNRSLTAKSAEASRTLERMIADQQVRALHYVCV